ncbi:hypothetical protein BD408DRAFT_473751 [Parasitella parasitica]|nr:hypothetical protein BD408DRAFT_473751 [Parasitella parasitica]
MPFCKCGELCLDSKCKKCGFDFEEAAEKKNHKVDRWQSRYLGNVVGLDNLSSPLDEEDRSACSPLSQHTNSPIIKRISKPFSSLLDSRRVTPFKSITSPSLNKRYSMNNLTLSNCGECHKKLSGKTVRLPDSHVKYHWSCLQCKECHLPFEDTSFFIDALKNVYHPSCTPSNAVVQNCSRCSQVITDNYLALNATVLHPRCFRCTGCQKILHPASIYIDLNGSHCQTCSSDNITDKETLSKHMKIVPQLLKVAANNGISITTKHCFSPVEEIATSPNGYIADTVKPSSLMSSRGRRPLPRFGLIRDCAGCNQRILSVHEEIPGPKASKWHKKCLVCSGCNKTLDSGATVHEQAESNALKPWCTTCLLRDYYSP